MLSLRKDKDKEIWYNASLQPNVGTSLYLEICSDAQSDDDSSSGSDAELMQFLQSDNDVLPA